MNLIEISKPFEAYVSVENLPRSADGRRFVLRLVFQVEGSLNSREMTWPWVYSGTQEAVDQQAAIDGLRDRCVREMDTFRRHIEYELGLQKCRLYEKTGSDVLVWAQNR